MIVEDDRRYREGLETLFEYTDGMEVVGSYGDATEALQVAQRLADEGRSAPWDVVVTDLSLPTIDGIEGTRRLKQFWPDLPVVVVTVFEEPSTILRAICAGADGYLLKSTPAREVVRQLRIVVEGGAPLTSGVARSLLTLLRQQASDPTGPAPDRLDLSVREQEVLRCLVQGLAYKEVAHELSISIDTVRSHIRRLYKKLRVHSVAEAVSRAIREGLV